MKAKLWLPTVVLVGLVLLATASTHASAMTSTKAKRSALSWDSRLAAAMISRLAPSGVTWASIFPAFPPSWSKI